MTIQFIVIRTTLPRLVMSCLFSVICLSGYANASTMTFTDSASFFAALPGPSSTQDFEGIPAFTVIPDGSSIDNITYRSNILTGDLTVNNFVSTTSGQHYLGSAIERPFFSGDELSFNFSAPVQAFGLFVTGRADQDRIVGNDLQLAGGGVSVFNANSAERALVGDREAFFMGLINPDGFTEAQLISFGDPANPFFSFNVDDLTTVTAVVPLPPAVLFFASGLLAFARKWRLHQNHQLI